jgi:hypothetical protein
MARNFASHQPVSGTDVLMPNLQYTLRAPQDTICHSAEAGITAMKGKMTKLPALELAQPL